MLANHDHEVMDVLVIGAGLSGIGLACYLTKLQPGKTFTILEARGATGGTWDLFRYPGVRSDSDLHTFGYEFKPWEDRKSIADGDAILAYLRQAAAEHDIDRHVQLRQKVLTADWRSDDAMWSVVVEDLDTSQRRLVRCRWLFSAAGYFRHDEGYLPRFEGIDRFRGRCVHPQHWPQDLDYGGKRVVVIGSGATAVTLLPAMAREAAHVTMLQRTPTYILSLPSEDAVANALRKLLPARWAYAITRRKNIAVARAFWHYCRRWPRAARRLIRRANARALPAGFPVDEHFNPPYDPWDQRLCAVPDGDLFKVIRSGKASVVTDRIRHFTERGLLLESGRELEADIVVTATGLNVQLFGGVRLSVDGAPVDLTKKLTFRGMMLSDVPNFAFAIGYTNSSWTLKVGLLCEHFCRLLGHMDRTRTATCVAEVPEATMPTRPLMDFGAGYVRRALKDMPRQGAKAPWTMCMDYKMDVGLLRRGPIEDSGLRFRGPVSHPVHAPAVAGRQTERT